MKNNEKVVFLPFLAVFFLAAASCAGQNPVQQPMGSGLEGEVTGDGSDIAMNDKMKGENGEDGTGILVAQNTQGGQSNPGDSQGSAKYIQIREGTPTLGGQNCPAGSAIAEGSNDTAGRVSISTNDTSFTCVIYFSIPYPAPPVCVITGSGWATPPTMTFKVHSTSEEFVEVSGVTPTPGLAGYVFNYLCI